MNFKLYYFTLKLKKFCSFFFNNTHFKKLKNKGYVFIMQKEKFKDLFKTAISHFLFSSSRKCPRLRF